MTKEQLWALTPFSNESNWIDVHGTPTVTLHAGVDAVGWPAAQPGPLDATGGFQSHCVSMSFSVDAATDSVLTLEFTSERGPCPELEILIDQHRGLFHPTVVRADRTGTGEPGPVAGVSTVCVPIPAEWLGAGEHTISVTTVLDEAAALGDRPGLDHSLAHSPSETLPTPRSHYGSWFGAYIHWWSARLEAVDDAQPACVSVALQATPFYIEGDGGDAELVDCDVFWPAGSSRPEGLILRWNDATAEVPAIPHDRDFGMFRWRFPVPELTGPTIVRIDGLGESAEQQITPCRKWQLHLIPHVHLDLGFTDSQGKVLELHCRNIDRALDLFDADPRFRFTVDGSVIAHEYDRTRSSDQAGRMHRAIANGWLGINSFHSNFLSGVVGLPELVRSTTFARTLPVSESTGLRYANLTDVPTHARAIPSVLADLGIDGFVGMSNHGRAATDSSDELHLISPVRWQGPDGREVLSHFADHYSQLRFIAADPQSLAGASDGLGRYLSRYEREDYLPTDLAVIGTHADNEDLGDGDVGFVDRWNAAFTWPRMRVSTFDEYLSSVAPLTDRLPVWKSESGSYWEDGVGSAASDFASYRRTQAALPASETLGTLVAGRSPDLRLNDHEYGRAWSDLSVAAEHTLTWARSMSHPHAFSVSDQLGWKTRYIEDAHRVSIDEPRRHAAQLAEVEGLDGPGVIVYNPHAWAADLDCELDLADGVRLLGQHVVVPVEQLSSCAGMQRVRFRVTGMAAHSWRYFPLSTGLVTLPGGNADPQGAAGRVTADYHDGSETTRVETEAWIVELDPSARLPTSVRHRASGRELLDARAAHSLGQVIRTAEAPFSAAESEELLHPASVHGHVRRRTLPIENFRYVPEPEPSSLVLESPAVAFVGHRSTFDGVRLRWVGAGVGIESLELELVLRDDGSVCDLDVRFVKLPVLDMEAIYIAFGEFRLSLQHWVLLGRIVVAAWLA